MSVGLYGAFLAIQTGRHRGYFARREDDVPRRRRIAARPLPPLAGTRCCWSPIWRRCRSWREQLAHPIDYFIETLHAPAALGGVIIALLVAMPEAIAAHPRRASPITLQRSINIFLGSVLSTIGLTVPVMLAISYFTSHQVYLGLDSANNMLLPLTLAVSVVTFASGRTNILQGAVHVMLFAAFVMLIFQN